MNNNDHTICAVLLWEAMVEKKFLQMENVALKLEIEKLNSKKAKRKEATNASES